jgi:hypothetical protein
MVEVDTRAYRHSPEEETRARRLRHQAAWPFGVLGLVTLLLTDQPTARLRVGAPDADSLFGLSLGAPSGDRL